MVKNQSIIVNNNEIKFIVTDFKNEIIVTYRGTVPNLFAEGKGVVAEGKLQDKKYFVAKRILAKHDENYMPPKNKKKLNDKWVWKFNSSTFYFNKFFFNFFLNNWIKK